MDILTPPELVVDFHIHSHYSRATSLEMNILSLYKWGKIKGIHILGTGDFTHPQWFAELTDKLEKAEPGLYKLKEKYAKEIDKELPLSVKKNFIRFILSAEIATIYSKNGKVRKLHNLIIAPNFENASQLNETLSKIGNLHSDGRPILGLDSKELLRHCIDISSDMCFIPAHIWTPWFSVFGSKSGFNTLTEAFEELTSHIYAIETGLSSDPYMNWRLSQLDEITIVSNSDAHSPRNLGREATVFQCIPNYSEIFSAIKTRDKRIIGTIEFFPQEGKYHYDGHRACNVQFSPVETKKHNGICPKCGKPLTLGVDYRVEELADRDEDFKPEHHKTVEYIIPLAELISQTFNVKGVLTSRVLEQYEKLYTCFGDEFSILRTVPINELKKEGFYEVSKAVAAMRQGKIKVNPGYDGVYGKIEVIMEDSVQLGLL
jgi:DNA helicase II / ATP-dependent DNA helicase PcrA